MGEKKEKKNSYITISAILLAVIPMLLSLIMSVFLTINQYNQSTAALQSTSDTIANYISQTYQNATKGVGTESRLPVYAASLSDPSDSDTKAQAQALMDAATSTNTNVANSYIVDASGKVYIATEASMVGTDMSDSESYTALSSKSSTYCVMDLDNNEPILLVGNRIESGGQFVGYLVRIVRLPLVTTLAQQAGAGGTKIILLGPDQNLVYTPNEDGTAVTAAIEERDSLTELRDKVTTSDNADETSETGQVLFTLDDVQTVGAYTDITEVDWIVTACIPKAVLMYDVNRLQLFNLLLTLALTTATVLITRSLIAKVIKPFSRCNTVLGEYLNEDYDSRIDENSGIDQASQIGGKINELGDVLIEKNKEIDQCRQTIRRLITLDERTKLMSRSAIYNRIAQLFGHTENQALVMMDINGYKPLVSLYGQGFGTKMLEEAATVLKRFTSKRVDIARLGDDDFLLFYSNFKSEEQVLEQVLKIMKEIGEISNIDGQEISLQVNAGIVYLDDEITSRTVWMRSADEAKFLAKQSPKHYYIYEGAAPDAKAEDDDRTAAENVPAPNLENVINGDRSDFYIAGDSRSELDTGDFPGPHNFKNSDDADRHEDPYDSDDIHNSDDPDDPDNSADPDDPDNG